MKHMVPNFSKLDKFKGVDFRRWQKKMHFLLSTLSMMYVLNTPIPNDGDDATVEQIRKRNKWDNDDCVCHGIILNGMSDFCLIYTKILNLKKNYGISWRPNMRMHQVKKFLVSCIIDKLFPSWKEFKHTLKHKKEVLTLVELGNHLHIEESFWVQDSDKPKSNNVDGPLVINMVKHNNSIRYNDNKGKCKHLDTKADPNKKSKVTC
ncbi:hypothetical protein Tco_1119343 [Tanacetum coccineum]